MSARLHWSRNLPNVGAGITGGEPGSSAPASHATALGWERAIARIAVLRAALQGAEDAAAGCEIAITEAAQRVYTRDEIAAAKKAATQ